MDPRAARAGVLLSLAECIRFGITSVSDLYPFPEVTAQAVAEVGLKANIAPALTLFSDESEDFDFEKDPSCPISISSISLSPTEGITISENLILVKRLLKYCSIIPPPCRCVFQRVDLYHMSLS